jgi:hypothetical protein
MSQKAFGCVDLNEEYVHMKTTSDVNKGWQERWLIPAIIYALFTLLVGFIVLIMIVLYQTDSWAKSEIQMWLGLIVMAIVGLIMDAIVFMHYELKECETCVLPAIITVIDAGILAALLFTSLTVGHIISAFLLGNFSILFLMLPIGLIMGFSSIITGGGAPVEGIGSRGPRTSYQ